MYEHKREPLLSLGLFIRRLFLHVLAGVGMILGSLLLGVIGYHYWGKLPWLDALLNSSMILGGMGPVDSLGTRNGKLFASFYALFAGVIFLVVVGVMMAPAAHRVLHRLHLEADSVR